MDDKIKKAMEEAKIKETLTQEFNLFLDQKVKRYLEVRPHEIVSNSHFAAVSTECYQLYINCHYCGTISLTQAVAEALAKFLCNKNGWKPDDNFEKNIKKLGTRGKISNEIANLFVKIWNNRDDYHHLNPKIEQSRQKLEILAKEKLINLNKIEKEFFAYTINKGKIVPKYQKYWDLKENVAKVFLRINT